MITSNNVLALNIFGNGSPEDLLQHPPWTEVKVARRHFLKFFSHTSWVQLWCFFQSSKTAWNQHYLPKVTESGLMMTWTSYLNAQAYNLSGWLNFMYSITSEVWNFWRQVLPVKTKVKKTQSTLAFSIYFTTWKMKCIFWNISSISICSLGL